MAERKKPKRQRDLLDYPRLVAGLVAARTPQAPRIVCAVFGCRGSDRDPGVSFRPFPKEPERWSEWLKLINRQDLAPKLRAGRCSALVCSAHFSGDDVTPTRQLPTTRRAFVYEVPTVEVKTETTEEERTVVEIKFEPEEPPTAPICDPPAEHQPRPTIVTSRPNIAQPGPTIVTSRPNVAQPGPNVEQPPTIVEQSRPIASRVKTNEPSRPIVQLSLADLLAANSKPIVKQLSPIVNQPKVEPRQVNPPPKGRRINVWKSVKREPHYLENQHHAEAQTDSKEAFYRLATFSAVEQINIPPTLCPRLADVRNRSVGVQTDIELTEYFTIGIKKKLEEQLEEANKKLKDLENPYVEKSQFLRGCDKYLDEKIANFVKSHAYLTNKFDGKKYPAEFKTFALNLYLRNPTSYKFVEQFFHLPSRKAIQQFQMPVSTGISDRLMQSLKIKVDQMSPKGKICVVCFDVIQLSRKLFYDVTNDYLCGMEEIDQVFGPEPAEFAAVIMARGLYTRWKQPVSFALVSRIPKYPELKAWLDKTITALFDMGLIVKALVRNLDDEFLDFIVEENEPYFQVNEQRIYHIFDVPSLFKSARDQLMQYNFFIGDAVAKWEDVLRVYDSDKYQEFRLMSDITDKHIRPDGDEINSIKLATQVFKGSVAAAMHFHVVARLHNKKTKDTVEFITKMSKLYDILYSRTLANAYRASAAQKRFLKDTLEYLRVLIVRDAEGNIIENQFVPGLIINIRSVMALTTDLKKTGVNYLLTKNLSKDCMQKYFEDVKRLGNCERPSPIMFTRFFRRLFLVNLLNDTKVGATEDDMMVTLTKIAEYVKADMDKQVELVPGKSLAVGVTDYKVRWPSNEYIAGYLLWKCIERHACKAMIDKLCRICQIEGKRTPETVIQAFQCYNSGNTNRSDLVYPPSLLTEFVNAMEKKLDDYFSSPDRQNSSLGWNMYSTIASDFFWMPCLCFPLKYLKMLYIRLRIFHSVKEYNRNDKNRQILNVNHN